MSIFKEPVKAEIKSQINRRQTTMSTSARTPQQLTWLNSRNSWIRMSSAVEVNGDKGALAQQYVLQGGTLNLNTNNNTAVTSSLKTGVGQTFDNAYATQNAGGDNYRSGIRPMPGIVSVDVKSRGAYGSLREATVTFQCWDIKQLEELELLYMRPGYSVLLEWGWSPYLNNAGGLVTTIDPINNIILGTGTKEAIWQEIFKRNLKSNGNYDAIYGIIKNYGWKARPDGGYDCTTTLLTIGEVLESLKINYAANDTKIPQNGLFQTDLQRLAIPIPFTLDSVYSKAHQSNIVAGMVTELYTIGIYGTGGLGIRGTKSAVVPVNGGAGAGGLDLLMGRFEVSATNRAQNIKGTVFDNDINIYILLSSFIDLLNKYILIQDGNNPYAAVSVREGEHMEHPGRPLLCLGNRYQISTNPLICLIDNNEYIDPATLGYASSCTKISDTMKNLVVGMYDFSRSAGTDSYFYDAPGINSNEYGIIGNIYINLGYIYSLVIDENLENTDKKEKKDINLFDFLKSLMNGINATIGNMAKFELFVDPQDSIIRIIDINYVNPEPTVNVIKNSPTIQLQNTLSIARNYSFESQIFPEQSTIVAIGAQTEGGPLGENVKTLIDFNQNLVDRIIPQKLVPTSRGSTAADKQTNLKKNFEVLSSYFCELAPDWWEIVGDFDVNEASKYENALRDIINYVLENPNLGGLNNKSIIPTKLSIEMDGLGGFIIGNIFTINDDVVPRGYKGLNNTGVEIGYVVTGINHKIGNGDWATTIDSQFIILEDPNPTKNLTAASTPPISISDGILAATNISISGDIYVGSIKANYTVAIDKANQTDTKVNFTHLLTLKDGKQVPIEGSAVIPAGSTSIVVEIDVPEYNADDLVYNKDVYTNTVATNVSNNYTVNYNTIYSSTPQDANKTTQPPTAAQKPEQKPCPTFPTDAKTVVDLVIQALDKLKYPYSKTPYHLNVVGIRNTDKDFGIPSVKPNPLGATPTNVKFPLSTPPSPPPTTPTVTSTPPPSSPVTSFIGAIEEFTGINIPGIGPEKQKILPTPPPPPSSPSRHEGSAIYQKGFLGEGKKGKSVVNTFTDWLVCWYYDNKGTRFNHFGKATTVPGKTYQSVEFWKENGVSLGRNITLLEGHYTNFYVKGTHNNQQNTLKLSTNYTSPRPIYRIDRGLDSTYSFDGYWEGEIKDPKNPKQLISAKINNPYKTNEGKGLIAPSTNIHNSGDYQNNDPSKLVNKWSAGCQVWRNINEWKKMSDWVVQQVNKTKKETFSYSLLNIRDLPGFENCQDTVIP